MQVLSALLEKEVSFKTAGAMIAQSKLWSTIKEQFLKEIGINTWEESQEKFPAYAKKERLMKFNPTSQQFKVYNLTCCMHNGYSALPSNQDFCGKIRISQSQPSASTCSNDTDADEDVLVVDMSTVRIRTCPVSEISPGSWSLVVLDLREVCVVVEVGCFYAMWITQDSETEDILACVIERNREKKFTLAVHHYSCREKQKLQAMIQDAGFAIVREFTVCVVPSGKLCCITSIKINH